MTKRRSQSCSAIVSAALAWFALSHTAIAADYPVVIQPGYSQLRDQAAVFETNSLPARPDGNVEIRIFGVKVMMPTCPVCLSYKFRDTDPNTSNSKQLAPKVADIITHPELIRELESNSKRITLEMSNDWRSEVNQGPFLNRFKANEIPWTAYIYMTFFRDKKTRPCWTSEKPDIECLQVHYLDVFERSTNESANSISIVKGPFAHYLGQQGGSIVLAEGNIIYVSSANNGKDAVGLPAIIYCNIVKLCDNTLHHTSSGFALRGNVELFLSFSINMPVPQRDLSAEELFRFYERTRSAVTSILEE